jgi:hypothetical protein
MNETEINRQIAEELGWKQRVHGKWSRNGDLLNILNEAPNFVLDLNTRPQMLAAMTRDEKGELIELAFKQLNHSGECAIDFEINLIELTQPEFCKLFLAVKMKGKE